MEHQVIVIDDRKDEEEDDTEKVLLYDPNEGRATKRQLCIFSFMWLLLSIFTPIWLVSIVERPYTITYPPATVTGFRISPASECFTTDLCGENVVSFNMSLVADFPEAPATAYPPVLFASVSHPNPHWWVAAVAREPLSRLKQDWNVYGGCYGAAGGKLYIVACVPWEGQTFTQGDQVRGPPFDDRCSAIGTWCGATCTYVINPPQCNADTHEIIPFEQGNKNNIIANNDPALLEGTFTYTAHSTGVLTMAFLFFTAFSFVSFLLNHCSPVVAFLERLGKSEEVELRERYLPLERVKYKGNELAVGVVSVFCYEKAFHIARNLIGVACAWSTLAKVSKALHFTHVRTIHYVVDNSHGKADSCMLALVARFVQFFNDNPQIEWDAVLMGLQDAPFEPTASEYERMLPLPLRKTIADFLDGIGEDRAFFDPFDKKNGAPPARSPDLESGDKEKKYVPLLLAGNIAVEVTIVRLANGTRGKVQALQECANRFHDFKKDAVGFLAIMDARHMMTSAFWQHTLPSFFIPGSKLGVISRLNGADSEDEYFENTNMRLCQVMQHFPVVDAENDYFDRGNFFNYLYSNALRNQIQSVTSCGTNALWSMRDFPNREKFNFSGKTLIEDTETSHLLMEYGESSVYISKALVHGSVKNPEDYGEAPSRWAAGAMQLLVHQPSAPTYIVINVITFLLFPLLIMLIATYVNHADWLMLFIWALVMVGLLLWAVPSGRHAAQVVIRMVNTTYWLTGPFTAIFWMLLMPVYILFAGKLPFDFNAEAMMVGGLFINVLQWVITVLAKGWAKAQEVHLWRSQQAWFALWPLNFLGLPRLLNPHTSWQISTIQAKVTFAINASELALLVSGLVYTLLNIEARVTSLASVAAQLVGVFTTMYSIALLFPTTSYLFNSLVRGRRHTYNVSSRHILGGFLVICLVFYLLQTPDWTVAFSQIFKPAVPTWRSG